MSLFYNKHWFQRISRCGGKPNIWRKHIKQEANRRQCLVSGERNSLAKDAQNKKKPDPVGGQGWFFIVSYLEMLSKSVYKHPHFNPTPKYEK